MQGERGFSSKSPSPKTFQNKGKKQVLYTMAKLTLASRQGLGGP